MVDALSRLVSSSVDFRADRAKQRDSRTYGDGLPLLAHRHTLVAFYRIRFPWSQVRPVQLDPDHVLPVQLLADHVLPDQVEPVQ